MADDEVRARGKRYPREVVDPAPPMPRPVRERASRLEPTPVSFGFGGRLVCTLIAFLPTIVFLVRGTIFWLFVALGSIPIGLWWIRETWRRPDV